MDCDQKKYDNIKNRSNFNKLFFYLRDDLKIKSSADWATRDINSFLKAHQESLILPLLVKLGFLKPCQYFHGGAAYACRYWTKSEWTEFAIKNFSTVREWQEKSPTLYRYSLDKISPSSILHVEICKKNKWSNMSEEELLTFIRKHSVDVIEQLPPGLKDHIYNRRGRHVLKSVKTIMRLKRKQREKQPKPAKYWSGERVVQIIKDLKISDKQECRTKHPTIYRMLTSPKKHCREIIRAILDDGVWTEKELSPKQRQKDYVKIGEILVAKALRARADFTCLIHLDKKIYHTLNSKEERRNLKAYVHFRLGYFPQEKMDYIYAWSIEEVKSLLKMFSLPNKERNTLGLQEFIEQININTVV